MEKINDLFDVQVAKTIDAYPSVFSKDDVITLLTNLRTETLLAIHEAEIVINLSSAEKEAKFQEFSESVTRELERNINNGSIDVYDYQSPEFSIDYNNTIVIDNIDFNCDSVTEELSDILLEKFQEFYGDIKVAE